MYRKKAERRFVLIFNKNKESKKALELVNNHTEPKVETYFTDEKDRRLPALLANDGNFYGYKMIEIYLNSIKPSWASSFLYLG